MKKIFVFNIISIVIFGCSTSRLATTTSSSTSEEEFTKLNHRWGTEYTYADFSKGHNLYSGNCGRCHQLYQPADYTEDNWNGILPVMIERAKLSKAKQELIYKYLITSIEAAAK